MVFDITHLKQIRKQLNLTQHKFAKEAGISQSMIAKIESGRLDPTYTYVKKIENTIENLTKSKNQEKKAKDIINKNIISIKKDEKIKKILPLFSKYEISQIPVIENNNIIGIITESAIINKLSSNILNNTVQEIMEPTPPIITQETEIQIITSLLKFYPLLIVQEKGKLEGIITKSDILKNL